MCRWLKAFKTCLLHLLTLMINSLFFFPHCSHSSAGVHSEQCGDCSQHCSHRAHHSLPEISGIVQIQRETRTQLQCTVYITLCTKYIQYSCQSYYCRLRVVFSRYAYVCTCRQLVTIISAHVVASKTSTIFLFFYRHEGYTSRWNG